MSYTDIHESGTCRALPLRDAWGRPHRDSWWQERQADERTSQPTRGTFQARSLELMAGVTA